MPIANSPAGDSATSRPYPKRRLVHAAQHHSPCAECLAGPLWTLVRFHEIVTRRRYTFLMLSRTSHSPRFRTPMPTTVVASFRTKRGNLVQDTRTIVQRISRPGPFQDQRYVSRVNQQRIALTRIIFAERRADDGRKCDKPQKSALWSDLCRI